MFFIFTKLKINFHVFEQIKGKIVLYNPPYENYGKSVAYRLNGAAEAGKHGAVACIVRSVADFCIASPHTGVQFYVEGVPKIPVATIPPADANMIHRIISRGKVVKLLLKMEAENLPDFESRNTILEVKGQTSPEEIVLVSGHLDSWDQGTGAMDDAGQSYNHKLLKDEFNHHFLLQEVALYPG